LEQVSFAENAAAKLKRDAAAETKVENAGRQMCKAQAKKSAATATKKALQEEEKLLQAAMITEAGRKENRASSEEFKLIG
jgi:hypothetical protein